MTYVKFVLSGWEKNKIVPSCSEPHVIKLGNVIYCMCDALLFVLLHVAVWFALHSICVKVRQVVFYVGDRLTYRK